MSHFLLYLIVAYFTLDLMSFQKAFTVYITYYPKQNFTLIGKLELKIFQTKGFRLPCKINELCGSVCICVVRPVLLMVLILIIFSYSVDDIV